MRTYTLLLGVILGICVSVFGEEPAVEQWVVRYNGPGNDNDWPFAIAVDESGGVYVTGRCNGSSTDADYATVRYSFGGNQLWAAQYNGPANDYDAARDLAIDESGNVYVTGDSRGSGTGSDYATVKYTPDGNQLWVARYNGPDSDIDGAYALAVDSSGNVYVTGESTGSGSYSDYATIKYNADGNQLWVARYNGPGNDYDIALALAADSSGNVYVTGYSYGGSGTGYDYATIKYNPDGNQLWVARYNGPGDNGAYAYDLTVDNSGNVYVTGYSYDGPYPDYATVKYNPDGNQLWVARYNGPGNEDDCAEALAVDSSGNVYVTGQSVGSLGTYDYATVKYSADGNQLWAARYNGPENDYDTAKALAVDESGNVYVTGDSGDGITMYYATVKYGPDGNQLWVARYNGDPNWPAYGNALAVDSLGNVYVTGSSAGGGTYRDYATIKYRQHGYVVYVDANSTGANNGTSWADAYNYLQDVLADPNFIGPAEIWVAQGTYKPDEAYYVSIIPGDRTATFQLKNGVAIYGGFPSSGEPNWSDRDPNLYPTILSGDLDGNDVYISDPCDLLTEPTRAENSYHVVSSIETDANAILDGLTITAGNADGVSWPNRHGGGMFNFKANCTINMCRFVENSSTFGGAMCGNTWSDLYVSNCIFYRNAAADNGGGIDFYQSDHAAVVNCTFSENVGINSGGGGMSVVDSNFPTLVNCRFISNKGLGSGANGGGLFNYVSSPTLTNCTFIGNSASFIGGGMRNFSSDAVALTNCTFSENSAGAYGGGIYDTNSNVTVTNCILWQNSDSGGTDESAQINDDLLPLVSYCCIQDLNDFAGNGNIGDDPKFRDTQGHVWSSSPCRNAGDPNGDYSGQKDTDGQPRVMEGRVDIGADELPPAIQNIDTGATYSTIQDAIDDANDGETIVVQNGTYMGAGNRDIDFLGKAITVRSSDPNDPNVVAATVIDCQGETRGVGFHSDEDTNSVLDGFTIMNGYAEDYGGGILCGPGSPTISHCVIRNCWAAYFGGGIVCVNSVPVITDSTIRNNIPDGVSVGPDSVVLILGTVHVISNDIVGEGSVQIDPDGSLDLDDAHVFCGMSGAGTMEVAVGAKATIDGDSVINLGDPCDPNVKGTIDCEGLLIVKDNSQITNARMNITKATFEDKAYISNSDIYVDSRAPYGSVFADPNTSFVDVNIYADGDRYMDLDPSIFDGNFVNVKIFVTITEGVGQPQGGLLECRGDDSFADVNSCDPNNIFFCMANPGTIPDCNTRSWTLERLELIPWAKVNLTNRFGFQPPYDPGDDNDVLYVRELILREGSILNTSYNRIYYESLTKEPNALIRNEPLLGFSMINIAMDDQTEFIVRVTNNNYTDLNEPNYSRIHVERVEDLEPDVNGMMVMRNLEDLDPNSGTCGEPIEARAKGLFAKSSEDEIFIRFEYLFGDVDPNTELVIYLSDIPELGNLNDANNYFEVARLFPPLPGQVGSVGSGKFGVFKEYVPTGGLNFVRGTRIEFMLLGGDGVHMYINNWDPQVHCSIVCLDVTGDKGTDEEDFLTVLGCFGESTESPAYACLEGPFGEDGTVDSRDICGWDWILNSGDRLNCCSLPLTGSGGVGGSSYAYSGGSGYALTGGGGGLDDLLILGKKGTTDAPTKLEDCLYVFGCNGQYLNKSTPCSDRANIRLVTDFDGNIYQIDSEAGIVSLDSNEVIVGPAQLSDVNEPRYGSLANVYVGIQGTGDDSYGRPISDAAFAPDFPDNNLVYVVPVVVEPDGQEAYVATAKLQLSASSYSVVKLYDDPDANNPGDNRELDELREVEVDTAGNLYVLNAYSDNESDILWKYDTSSGTMIERLVLGDSNSVNYVPSPSAMHLSTAQDMLYVASSLNDPNATSSTVYGFSTGGYMTLARTIDINGMGHATGITEDPISGTLWVVGFTMDPPESPNPYGLPFYDPNLAEVPIGSNDVTAISAVGADPNNDLAMPLSIVWTGVISLQQNCGGADLDSSGDVDLKDFGAFAQRWEETGCVVPDWCAGADMDPYIRDRGQVDLMDLAILSQNWLESGCLD